jgi:hypothetical protein
MKMERLLRDHPQFIEGERDGMSGIEVHLDLTSKEVQCQIIKGRHPSMVNKGICKEVVVTMGLNKITHHSKTVVLQGQAVVCR